MKTLTTTVLFTVIGAAALIAPVQASAVTETKVYAVERIASGTTLAVRDMKAGTRHRIRLAMVRQPSKHYSPQASPEERLSDLLRGAQELTVHVIYTDSTGYQVALVDSPRDPGKTINSELVRSGDLFFTGEFADHEDLAPYFYHIRAASDSAQSDGVGIWASPYGRNLIAKGRGEW